MKKMIIFCLLLCQFSALSQSILNEEMEESCSSFDYCYDFEAKKNKRFTNKDFYYHKKTYDIQASVNEVFDFLSNSHPKEIWINDSQYVKTYENGNIYDQDDEHNFVRENQIIFLNLTIRILTTKVLHVPVQFKILKMTKKELVFSYLKSNTSKGIQRLRLETSKNGDTQVIHETRYISGSKIRDLLFYKKFHEVLMDDFYLNLENKIKAARR
jgi:hypothetical protein